VMASEAYHICQMLVIYLMLQIQVLGKYRFPVSKYEILQSCCNVCESDSQLGVICDCCTVINRLFPVFEIVCK
jgi:hypothetical protein